jgi:hypothetical protein
VCEKKKTWRNSFFSCKPRFNPRLLEVVEHAFLVCSTTTNVSIAFYLLVLKLLAIGEWIMAVLLPVQADVKENVAVWFRCSLSKQTANGNSKYSQHQLLNSCRERDLITIAMQSANFNWIRLCF